MNPPRSLRDALEPNGPSASCRSAGTTRCLVAVSARRSTFQVDSLRATPSAQAGILTKIPI